MKYESAVGTCQECGKQSFITRKAARKFMNKKFPSDSMSIYKCGDYYHFGHTPWGIKRGITDRREWTREPGPRSRGHRA